MVQYWQEVNEFTDLERLDLYIEMKGFFELRLQHKLYEGGFCKAALWAIHKIQRIYPGSDVLKLFPELKEPWFYTYVRQYLNYTNFWYPKNKRGIRKRIKILSKIIKELNAKIEHKKKVAESMNSMCII